MFVKQKIKAALPPGVVNIISVIRKQTAVFNPWNWYIVYFGGVRISYLVVSVGQACNFKCRDCANFAPICPSEFKRYGVNDIKKDLTKLFESVESIDQLQIQGGEPLLYSDLEELLDFLYENKSKVHKIVIATNGSLMPNDKLMECFKRNNVCVRVSDYGIAEESCSLLIKELRQRDIQSCLYTFVSEKSMWYDCGGKNAGGGGELKYGKGITHVISRGV